MALKKFRKPRNHGKTWTLNHQLDLAEYYVSGKSFVYIARRLGRSLPACQMRMRMVILAANMVKHGNCTHLLQRL